MTPRVLAAAAVGWSALLLLAPVRTAAADEPSAGPPESAPAADTMMAAPPESAPAESAPAESAPAETGPTTWPAPGLAMPLETEKPPEPRSHLSVSGRLVGTLNREGVLLEVDLDYHYRLYDSKSEAFSDNYLGFGIMTQSSPIFVQPGPYLELAPTSFLRIRVAYQLIAYFGVLNSALWLDDCRADLDRDDPTCNFDVDLFDPVDNHGSAIGHRLFGEAELRLRVWRIVLSNTFSVERWWFPRSWGGSGPDSFWYNEAHYVPQRRAGTVYSNIGYLFFEVLKDRGGAKPHLMIGASTRLHYSVSVEYGMHRAGPAVVLRIPEWKGYRDLAAVLLIQWYTHDRYSAGPGPFVALVLSVSSKSFM